jgi:methylglutaconyl-CoA hydratase
MSKEYKTIKVAKDKNVFTVSLNRPTVHNAMNELMIAELTDVFKIIGVDISARVAILRGEGKSFCAGADLNYMNSIAKYGYEENVEDGKRLARLFDTIYACEVPTIALVHGAAFGGANGLLAACDIVVAEEKTTFAFSEVKLGIAPATISPFVIKRIGEFGAKELMMTGKRFNGEEAEKWNLVNKSVPFEELEKVLNEYIKHFLTSAPEAVKVTKKMINNVISSGDFENVKINMAQLIAKLRDSDEGKEGMSAFLEKRKPKWIE